MEKQLKSYLTVPYAAAASLALLTIPLVTMQFTDEVRWSLSDFALMGLLLFSASSVLVLALRVTSRIAYRAGALIAISTTFLMVWANLAVGLIGAGPNAANVMYGGVVGILVVAVYLSRLKAKGMQRAMFITASAVLLTGVIALLTNMQNYPGSSVKEIVAVSVFFAIPYLASGLLFRFDARSAQAIR